MKKYRYLAKIGLFELLLITFDQISKYWATIRLKGKNDFDIIKDVLSLHYLDGGNTGAAWGMLSGKIIVFIIFTIFAIIVIAKFMWNTYRLLKRTNKLSIKILNLSLALLMAGAIGNLIDRIIHGYVIDFIYFKLINFPIFNVADCYVTVSCVLIIIICAFKLNEEEFNYILSLKKEE